MKKFILTVILLTICGAQSYSQWTYDWRTTYSRSGSSLEGLSHSKVKGGYIYVTGSSYIWPGVIPGSYTISTVKYNSSGTQQWVANYTSTYSDSYDHIESNGIDVDDNGNVYIIGTDYNGSDYDYVTIKYNSSGTQQWVQQYDGGGDDKGGAIGFDDVNGNTYNVFVTGASQSLEDGGTMDIFTICYNSSGTTEEWTQRFIHPTYHDNGDDNAISLAIDNNNSHADKGYGIYVAGSYDNGYWLHDAQIVHYNFDGSYSDPRGVDEVHYGCGPEVGEDWATAVVVSDDGDVYATGAKWCGEEGWKYQSHEFFTFWSFWVSTTGGYTFKIDETTPESYCDKARYYYMPSEENYGTSLLYDNDHAYATGYSMGNGTGMDFITIKYDTDGSHMWEQRYNSSGSYDDVATSITLLDGKIYVTGTSGVPGLSSIKTIQYDASTGNEDCVTTYSSYPGNVGNCIGNDGTYIYVAGITNESNNFGNVSDFITLRYTPCATDIAFKPKQNSVKVNSLPKVYALNQNYPNPFNPSTTITYSLPKSSYVSIKVYNMLGQRVLNINDKYQDPGYYSEHIDAGNWSSGIYFYQIEARDAGNSLNIYSATKKMLLIK